MVDNKIVDKFGSLVSTVCVVHCLLLPLVLTALPFLSVFTNPVFELSMVVVAIISAAFSAWDGFKKHRSYLPSMCFLPGAVLMGIHIMSHFFFEHPIFETPTLVTAALFLTFGHIWNYHLSGHCGVKGPCSQSCCHHDHQAPGSPE